MTAPIDTRPELTPRTPSRSLFGKSIWWWIAAVTISLCAIAFLWWGGSYVYYLLTFHPKGQIVYECWPERTSSRICIINADGTGYKQLTTYQTVDRVPSWSPDGKKIVFNREVNDKNLNLNFNLALFVMNLDGSDLKQLTDATISVGSPSWSPDGNRIAFTYRAVEGGKAGIAVINPYGKDLKFLTDSFEVEPVWSPDGTKIAYEVHKPIASNISTSALYIMNSDGSGQKRLTDTKDIADTTSPSWSPDGKRIVFDCLAVCVINVDGSGLATLERDGLHPSWSPDGQYIVYYWSDPWCILCPGSGQLWIMRADGSQQTKLTNGPVDQNPVWSPAPTRTPTP